ncbi:hypothetical protein BABINDRAFT_51996 [Babjeviella inositovora NRRL Y-12698]|uniref:Uncharacterized protein n=1 Tax=Babjeviella inositovora NRRL Y-12698 TaxID=984486 RepID=A0A1E3QMI2_9ASCO|nr:uncharacterized protein BABINDRAFT_51996 [Babjeviella inositovora NRRL Y-12698]ODQ78895.1 hypothetical protein BABINDRAFT_51996 [Babjeviella inositovora NRRL Y-12698]
MTGGRSPTPCSLRWWKALLAVAIKRAGGRTWKRFSVLTTEFQWSGINQFLSGVCLELASRTLLSQTPARLIPAE